MSCTECWWLFLRFNIENFFAFFFNQTEQTLLGEELCSSIYNLSIPWRPRHIHIHISIVESTEFSERQNVSAGEFLVRSNRLHGIRYQLSINHSLCSCVKVLSSPMFHFHFIICICSPIVISKNSKANDILPVIE